MEQDRETSGNAAVDLQLSRPTSAPTALGLAVAHMMTKPAFASLPFGDWSRVLVGQINCGHYAFVLAAARRVKGFAGWGLVRRAKAEAWVEGQYNLTYQGCLEGDCVVFNAWAADTPRVHHAASAWKRRDRGFADPPKTCVGTEREFLFRIVSLSGGKLPGVAAIRKILDNPGAAKILALENSSGLRLDSLHAPHAPRGVSLCSPIPNLPPRCALCRKSKPRSNAPSTRQSPSCGFI